MAYFWQNPAGTLNQNPLALHIKGTPTQAREAARRHGVTISKVARSLVKFGGPYTNAMASSDQHGAVARWFSADEGPAPFPPGSLLFYGDERHPWAQNPTDHWPFKERTRLGPGPKHQTLWEADDWSCVGKNYKYQCVGISDATEGRSKRVKVNRARKKVYNKLYRAWLKRKAARRAHGG